MATRTLGALAFLLLAAGVAPARAAATPEQQCQSGRFKAAATYVACVQKEIAKQILKPPPDPYTGFSKCGVKYAATWPKLQSKAAGTGSGCDVARFVDNGDGTVTDNLTALRWEQKGSADAVPNLADPHDVDNLYAWCVDTTPLDPVICDPAPADWPLFTSFLGPLNAGCFAGQCDWRLPTLAELYTLVSEPYPCVTSPCVDPALGATMAAYYWANAYAPSPQVAWLVGFGGGEVAATVKFVLNPARAVRGGL